MINSFKIGARVKGKESTVYAGRCGTITNPVKLADIKGTIMEVPSEWHIRFDDLPKTIRVKEADLDIL